jgi:dihydrofolate synthase / folylpolyglutamate synthase
MNTTLKNLDILANNEKTSGGFKNYNLKDIIYLLKVFGNPHKTFKTIHIAGTNGKGSVAHMLNSILIAGGRKTGLYTSPHLQRITERIKINDKEIPLNKLKKYTDELFEVLEKNNKVHPTYFDALTLFALRYFSEKKVDIAIIEVGLGGRLDSTNVINPEISVITDISLDHIHILGNTVREIAREKAGIIKKHGKLITSNQSRDVIDVLSKKSKEQSADMHAFNRDFFAFNIRNENQQITYDFTINTEEIVTIKNITLKTAGRFQIINSSLAIASIILLRKSGVIINESEMKKGLLDVNIPGRMQQLSQKPVILFDPAHNPAAMNATLNAVKEKYPGKKINAVVSFMIDKDYSTMFRILKKNINGKILYYELNDKRCFKISEYNYKNKKSICRDIESTNNFDELSRIISKLIKIYSVLLITGSFRLYEIARKLSNSK